MISRGAGCLGMAMAFTLGFCSAHAQNPPWQGASLDMVPAPKECMATGREFPITRDARIALACSRNSPILRSAAQVITQFFTQNGFVVLESSDSTPTPAADLTIFVGQGDLSKEPLPSALRGPAAPSQQGYALLTKKQAPGRIIACIHGSDDGGALYGTYTFLKSLRFTPDGFAVREVWVADEPALPVRGLSPQWAWYLGARAPYGETMWGLERWKTALDFMSEFRFNMLALCTYGKFPFPLEKYRSRCAVDLPFELWNPQKGVHTIRWTHPAYEDDFLGDLVEYAHARGIRVLIYSCLNLQDEIGSHQWTNEEEITAYCDIQQHLLRKYKIDGFIFESGEFYLSHPNDLARFGNDQWSRLKADLFLTRRYTEAIRAVKPDAVIGLVDHYLFKDWDEKKVPQREGLERWKAGLPPETLVAYVHSPETYDVFPPSRIWTYVFGPKGGLKPALQLHLSDFCDVPREKKVAGAYYVTYDWIPHEPNYLCFAESAWGNYGGHDKDRFVLHSSEGGVGGPISGRVWKNIKRELYGQGADFGEGLLTAGKGTFKGMWDVRAALRESLLGRLVRALDKGDFAAAQQIAGQVEAQRAFTERGLAQMTAERPRVSCALITNYPIQEHLDKAVLLAQTQLAWAEFVCAYYGTALALARNPHDAGPLSALRAAALSAHARIREALSRAYFSYPHDKIGKFEFLATPDPLVEEMSKLRLRFSLQVAADGTRLRLENAAPQATVTADSTFPSRYGPGFYEPRFAADGREGTPGKGIWVSAETPTPHFLQLDFARPVLLRGVVVNWAHDNANDWVPQEFSVQIHGKPVLEVKDNRETIAIARLDPPIKAQQVRVAITRGSRSRPNLGAISEVEVLVVKE